MKSKKYGYDVQSYADMTNKKIDESIEFWKECIKTHKERFGLKYNSAIAERELNSLRAERARRIGK
jgi:hypothetical protein